MKNRLKGVAILLIIIIVLILGVPRIINLVKYWGEDDDVPAGYDMTQEINDTLGNTPSDIEGWTMLDKLNAGLQPIEGVDSDADGLTDKEEIEVYHSDPAKASTSGDLYKDGYKIEHGMDLNTQYEYKNEFSFDSNTCDDIALTPKDAGDFSAHVAKEDNANINGYTAHKVYDLYSFSGDLSIDVSDVDEDDLVVLIGPWYGGDMDKAKFKRNGDVLEVDYDFDSNRRYTVVVATKNPGLNFSKPYLNLTFNSVGEMDLEDTDFVFVHFFFMRNMLYNAKPYMYYVSTGDTRADMKIEKYLLALAYDVTDGHVDVTDADCKLVSKAKMTSIKTVLNSFPDNEMRVDDEELRPAHYIFMWCDKVLYDESKYSAKVTDLVDVKNTTKSSSTGFDVGQDAFQFQNFGSEYATGGNCAGIAYYTASLFNTGAAPSSGSYSSSIYNNGDEIITWDISGDPENNTLIDTTISDYKDGSFVKNHKNSNGILDNLSGGEKEFIKMIASYFAQANDAADGANNLYYIDDSIGVYDWNIIENMMESLDNGKILILCMSKSNGKGHTINVVDYKISADGNTVKFTLYDNTFPNNMKKGSFIDNVLTVEKKEYAEGCTESFSYYYKPYSSCEYEYNSEEAACGFKSFVVMDSNLNKYN